MDIFEAEISRASDPKNRELLGAIVSVVNKYGTVLYHHQSGYQSLDPDAPPVDPNSTFIMGSAGKFITYVAALQCVDRGLIALDEPIYTHLPELESFKIISRNEDHDSSTQPFSFRTSTKKITLRQLLTHSSGIGDDSVPLLGEWKAWKTEEPDPDAHVIVRLFSMPLLFEPGEGWAYGASVYWIMLLIGRLTKTKYSEYIEKNIFEPLGMSSTTERLEDRPDIKSRLLKEVRRDVSGLVPSEEVHGLVSNTRDITTLLANLISPSPKILSKQSSDVIFIPHFTSSSSSLSDLRRSTDMYSIPAGIPSSAQDPPVNHSVLGLVVEDELPLSHMPAGTVTWNGMPNIIWAINRDKGLAMLFATQLVPVDDERTIEIAMHFFRDAWKTFGTS